MAWGFLVSLGIDENVYLIEGLEYEGWEYLHAHSYVICILN